MPCHARLHPCHTTTYTGITWLIWTLQHYQLKYFTMKSVALNSRVAAPTMPCLLCQTTYATPGKCLLCLVAFQHRYQFSFSADVWRKDLLALSHSCKPPQCRGGTSTVDPVKCLHGHAAHFWEDQQHNSEPNRCLPFLFIVPHAVNAAFWLKRGSNAITNIDTEVTPCQPN